MMELAWVLLLLLLVVGVLVALNERLETGCSGCGCCCGGRRRRVGRGAGRERVGRKLLLLLLIQVR